jgi:hypothetical protein
MHDVPTAERRDDIVPAKAADEIAALRTGEHIVVRCPHDDEGAV